MSVDTKPIRRRCASALILLCAAASLPAQNWTIGFNGGVAQGGFTGSREFNWHRTIPTTSLFLNRALSDRLSIQPEAVYHRRIGVSSVTGSTLTMTTDYLQFPVLLHYRMPTVGGIMPSVAGGPSFGLKLRCTLAFVGGGVNSEDDCDADRGVQSNIWDYGIAGGAGLARWFGNTLVSVEGRYSAGLRPFIVPLDEENSKSYGWSATVGVSFPLRPLVRPGRVPTMPGVPPLRTEPILMPPPSARREPDVAEPPRVGPVARLESNWLRRVTVNAIDVDARTLLLAIAREAGVNVVISSDVKSRVSLTATNVPAIEAIQSVIDVAGLSIITPSQPDRPATVFYQAPVDVNRASIDAITARFGVSPEMARLVVTSKPEAARTP